MASRMAVVESKLDRVESELKEVTKMQGQLIALQASVDNLLHIVSIQGKSIDNLTRLAANGKGAFWMFMTVGGVLAALVSWLVAHWKFWQ